MKHQTWPFIMSKGSVHTMMSCYTISRQVTEKSWSKSLVTTCIRNLSMSLDSEPVAGPSGIAQTSSTSMGSEACAGSGKRKREEACEMEQQASPSKKHRSNCPREDPTRETGQGKTQIKDGNNTCVGGKRKQEEVCDVEMQASPSKISRSNSPIENETRRTRRGKAKMKKKAPDGAATEVDRQERTQGQGPCREPAGPPPTLRIVHPPAALTKEEVRRNLKKLRAKYNILSCFQHGGYGLVYAGSRHLDNFPVIIKTTQKEYIKYTKMVVNGFMRRLPMEVALLIRVGAGPSSSGSKITPLLLDWFDLGKKIALVIERPVPCMDIIDYIQNQSSETVNTAEAKIIFRQLVEAAIEMEAKGVFHRDIKPDNILIESGSDIPTARYIDFGCGTTFSTGQIFTTQLATPAYSSSESVQNLPYTSEQATVWQLGCVLYTILLNKIPRLSERQIVSKRCIRIPRSIPEDCKNVLRGCWEKNPANRLSLEELKNHPWLN